MQRYPLKPLYLCKLLEAGLILTIPEATLALRDPAVGEALADALAVASAVALASSLACCFGDLWGAAWVAGFFEMVVCARR